MRKLQQKIINKVIISAKDGMPFAVILEENKIDSIKKAMNCAELWDIANGRTLSFMTHLQTPTYGWRTYNLLRRNISHKQ